MSQTEKPATGPATGELAERLRILCRRLDELRGRL